MWDPMECLQHLCVDINVSLRVLINVHFSVSSCKGLVIGDVMLILLKKSLGLYWLNGG